MLFSVVIPLYNKADTIKRAIRSVAEQTYRDYELIVVNDGSTDDSLSIVKGLSNSVQMRIIDKPNGGVSSARNAGALVASGAYIALLDGDDVWYQNHLELLACAIEKYPEIKFFGTGYEMLSGRNLYYTVPWGGCKIEDVYLTYRYAQPIHTSTVAIARDLWLKIGGFNEDFSFYEDYEFFFRMGLHTKCCTIRKISARYMDDAAEKATRIRPTISTETRPHIKFLDQYIKSDKATSQMIQYVSTLFRLDWALNVLRGDKENDTALKSAFPDLYHMVVPDIRYMRRLFAALILINYKIHNHLVVWKKCF